MFKKQFSTDIASIRDDASPNQDRGLRALRMAYSNWRVRNDAGAIATALNRLSNRQLHLIGLRREGIVGAVEDMILSVEEDRAIGREVIAIMDASVDSTFSCHDTTPPEGYPKHEQPRLSGPG